MRRPQRRLVVIVLAIVLVAGVAVGGLASVSHSTVTRARLERSLPATFANLYVQQARLLGHKGVTVRSLHARAQCDKGGPKVADVGPGADWICLMSWHDPNIDETLLPGKFEMNVHSNDCYTAGGPSKIVGLLTITDTHGNDVTNPVFEFDGCFDPRGNSSPTGVTITTTTNSTSTTPTPAALTLPHGSLVPDRAGRITPLLVCSSGVGGCAGTATATLGGRRLGALTYAIAPGKTTRLGFTLSPGQRRAGGKLIIAVEPVIGTSSAGSTTLVVKTG
jgi:hypothetical protein